MTTKKELVLRAIKGEEVERIPIGFWFHFVTQEEKSQGLNNPAIFQKNVQGHKKYIDAIKPDFVKIMSDGFFRYPNPLLSESITSIKELAGIQSIGKDHPWIQEQVDLIKEIVSLYSEEIASFYNIFSPVSYLKRWFYKSGSRGDDQIADFLKEDPDLLAHVLNVIGEDIGFLVQRIIQEAKIEGIYLSVQTIQDARISSDEYVKYIEPSNLQVLEAANEVGGQNILHICGFEGATNDIHLFKEYPAQIFNWASKAENISLEEGRDLFGGRTVLGGFENGKASLLLQATREEIEQETKRLIQNAGSRGLILGADCTVPNDFPLERLDWVREAAIL